METNNIYPFRRSEPQLLRIAMLPMQSYLPSFFFGVVLVELFTYCFLRRSISRDHSSTVVCFHGSKKRKGSSWQIIIFTTLAFALSKARCFGAHFFVVQRKGEKCEREKRLLVTFALSKSALRPKSLVRNVAMPSRIHNTGFRALTINSNYSTNHEHTQEHTRSQLNNGNSFNQHTRLVLRHILLRFQISKRLGLGKRLFDRQH